MAYVALYRRWRPQDFDALVGQQAVKTALSNALTSGRIAHAYLFSGPRGTGKTSTARILAKALNCENGPTPHPCGHCLNCERITAGTSTLGTRSACSFFSNGFSRIARAFSQIEQTGY